MMQCFIANKELEKIGLNILIRRHKMNLTQKELSRAASVSVSKISAIEHGKTDFTLTLLLRIADVLKVDYHELIK